MDQAAALLCAKQIVDELLESSSSSDDDEDDEISAALLQQNCLSGSNNFLENVIQQYTEVEFKKHLRVSRATVLYLTEKYASSCIRRTYQGGRQQVTVEKQVLSFLWFCGNKTTFREIGNLFNMSLSSIHSTFNRVLKFLVDELAPEVIKMPQTKADKAANAKEFEEISGFPKVLGCIGKTFISARTSKHQIQTPCTGRQDDKKVITLQAICDSKLKFLNVYTCVPSEVSDSKTHELLYFIRRVLPSICSPNYHVLGDSTYPLKECLMTPFPDYGQLTAADKHYNLLINRTLVIIEKAFAVLKNRFRQLMHLDFHKEATMAQFIVACCVLHNICIDRQDLYAEEIPVNLAVNLNSGSLAHDGCDNKLSRFAQLKRNELKDVLYMKTTKEI